MKLAQLFVLLVEKNLDFRVNVRYGLRRDAYALNWRQAFL